ncbi:MAG: hypothetical protein ACPGUU_02025 [Flavobacteriaceae bacterium]
MRKFVFVFAMLFSFYSFSQETKDKSITIFNYIDANLDVGNFDAGEGEVKPVIVPLNFSFHMPVISDMGIFLHFKLGVVDTYFSESGPPGPTITSTAISFSPGIGYKIETENFVPYASITYGVSWFTLRSEDWVTEEVTKTKSSGSGGEFNIGGYYFFKKWGKLGLHTNASFGFEGGSAINLGIAYRFTSKKNQSKYNLD